MREGVREAVFLPVVDFHAGIPGRACNIDPQKRALICGAGPNESVQS